MVLITDFPAPLPRSGPLPDLLITDTANESLRSSLFPKTGEEDKVQTHI